MARFCPFRLLPRPESEPGGQLTGTAHADRNPLPVPDRKIRQQLDRMAEGVPVVQKRTNSGLAFIAATTCALSSHERRISGTNLA